MLRRGEEGSRRVALLALEVIGIDGVAGLVTACWHIKPGSDG